MSDDETRDPRAIYVTVAVGDEVGKFVASLADLIETHGLDKTFGMDAMDLAEYVLTAMGGLGGSLRRIEERQEAAYRDASHALTNLIAEMNRNEN